MHSPERIIWVGQLRCTKQAVLYYVLRIAPDLCKSCHRKTVEQERKNVELSAEGGIDTAYNSRGGDLRLPVSVLGYS